MPFRFEIEAREDKARAGRFFTPHGEVETPVFMPVGTVGTVKGVRRTRWKSWRPDPAEQHLPPLPSAGRRAGAAAGRRAEFMAWDRPILTDSGGFQVFSLSDLRKVTEEGVPFARIWTARRISSARRARWRQRSAWAPTSSWPSTSAPSIRPSVAGAGVDGDDAALGEAE